jgi:hypothetical protein
MQSGAVYRHERFYRDRETGELKPKYILLLAPVAGGDWVTRLLTSRSSMRSENPPCDHSDPYPSYFLGVPGEPLTFKTWVDLRAMADLDSADFATREAKGVLRHVRTLDHQTFVEVLECAANAPDTTIQQESAIRDRLASLR